MREAIDTIDSFVRTELKTEHSPIERSTSLGHVNTAPAQTWNYLHINEQTLSVPAPPTAGGVYARLPQLFDTVEVGLGSEASNWIVASAGDARYVEVPAGCTLDEPIIIEVQAGQVKDTGVLIREGARADIVVVARGAVERHDPLAATSATLLRIVAEQAASVTVTELVTADSSCQHLGGIGITADKQASIAVRQYALGGGSVALGITTALNGTGAHLVHSMRYLVKGNDVLDVNHVVHQRGRMSTSDVRSSGVLTDHAHKTMRETIDLIHGAKGASGNEIETVLTAGQNIVNKTLPTILCDEDDVAGNHGASIGSISAEQADYLVSRGIDAPAIQALFERAIFDDAILHVPKGIARDAVLQRAAAVLGSDIAFDLAEALYEELGETRDEEV